MRKINKNGIAAILLLLLLLGFGGYTLLATGGGIAARIRDGSWFDLSRPHDETYQSLESGAHGTLPQRSAFRTVFSEMNTLLGKREVQQFYVVKDDAGYLHRGNFYQAVDPNVYNYAKRIRYLKEDKNQTSGKLLFVAAMDKYDPEVTEMPAGYPLNRAALRNMDDLLLRLYENSVETVDTRLTSASWPIGYDDSFFKTELYWTPAAALYTAFDIVDALEEKLGIALDPDGFYRDDGNYIFYEYPGIMQGSLGRTTGIPFGGLDDLSIPAPDFSTRFIRTTEGGATAFSSSGTFVGALAALDRFVEGSPQYNNPMTVFMDGFHARCNIQNVLNPGGAKIAIIGDVNFVPVAPYLAPMCSEVTLICPTADDFDITIRDELESGGYDCVIVGCAPSSIGEEMFLFMRSAAVPPEVVEDEE